MRHSPSRGGARRATARIRPAAVAGAALVMAVVAAVSGAVDRAEAAPAGFVTASGTTLELDGQPYRFTGINVYNATNASGCWYPMAAGSTLDDSLTAISASGGPKVMRSWFFQALATTGGVRDWSGFDHTLAVAAAHGTKVIVTLGNQWIDCDGPAGGAGSFKDEAWYTGGYAQPDPGGTVSYRDWVAEIVARYKDDPTILAWQLMNEAEVKPSAGSGSCSVNAAGILKSFAADVSGLIKSIDPNHLVSLGTIGGGQCGAQGAEYQDVHDVSTIDLCEYHDYGSPNTPMPGDQWNGLQVRLDQCRVLGKPLFVGETGINPSTVTQVGGTLLAQRAGAFEQKLRAQFAAGVVGELAWAWNKDGSAEADYDIGPGDPTLPMLAWWNTSSEGTVVRASLAAGGVEPNNRSLRPYVSADGRYVLFSSEASNLSPDDTFSNPGCGALDVFLKDTVTGAVELVNVDSNEVQLGGYCGSIGMGLSDNARYVVFESDAYRSLPHQYVGSDVFVRDRVAGTTTNLTAASNARNGNTQITPDGRYVLFGSEATNLAPNTSSCGVRWRQYVVDRQTQAIDLVSVDSSGADPCVGNGSNIGAISADGRYVAFYSDAVLAAGALPGSVYVRDRLLGQTTLVSYDESGTPVYGFAPAINADGRFVAFTSSYPRSDTYVVDRSTGVSERVNVDGDGVVLDSGFEYPAISAGGRFVTFAAVAFRNPGHYGPMATDLWVRDRVAGTSSRVVNGGGLPGGGASYSSFLTGDGRFLAFQSSGASWVAGDANGFEDVFVHERTGPLDAAAPQNPDLDGDGVANGIDVGDGAFDDGAGTFGSIVQPVPAGLNVLVEDLPAPDGVRVTVSGTGSEKASFSVCGFPGTLKLAAGSVLDLACASVILAPQQGVAELELFGGATVVSVPQGGKAEVSETSGGGFSVANQGAGVVTVTTGGSASTVQSGQTGAAVTTDGVCALTRRYVQGSAAYQALPAKQREKVDKKVDKACSELSPITPNVKPNKKAAALKAYKKEVDGLVKDGWLTAAQAVTLNRLADSL